MPKYPILRPKELTKALTKKGFKFKSQKGSHAKYSDGKHNVIIPMHNTIAPNTLRDILQQTGITLDELLGLL